MAIFAAESGFSVFGFDAVEAGPVAAFCPRIPACSGPLEVVTFSAPGTGWSEKCTTPCASVH
jgi:hypothetical protein